MKPQIVTASGNVFDFKHLSKNIIDIRDIAHALSHLCRYTGHTREFYSVAQHSVVVSQLVSRDRALIALLHDASEAYLNDISSPLKALLPDYQRLEYQVQWSIMKRFGITHNNWEADDIKAADRQAMAVEVACLMPETAAANKAFECIAHIDPTSVLHGERLAPMSSTEAYHMFLGRFYGLYHGEQHG